jgi:hypothetical protein
MVTKSEKEKYRKIAELGCILCYTKGHEGTACEIHHIRRAGQRKTAPTIGLCPIHHRFHLGIHHLGRRNWESTHNTTEETLLELTNRLLNGDS